MFGYNDTTKTSCQITYQVVKDNKTFPLHIIERISDLTKSMNRCGIINTRIMVCGSRIEINGSQKKYTIYPYDDCGPWKNIFVTRLLDHKIVVISLMCVLIVLYKEGYIYNLTVGKDIQYEGENNELWTTAWSIILDMEAKRYDEDN